MFALVPDIISTTTKISDNSYIMKLSSDNGDVTSELREN